MTEYILPSNTLTFYALSRKIKVFTDKMRADIEVQVKKKDPPMSGDPYKGMCDNWVIIIKQKNFRFHLVIA